MKNLKENKYRNILEFCNQELSTKIGYPGSLMSAIYGEIDQDQIRVGHTKNKIINNKIIGILPGSLAEVLINNVGSPWTESESYSVEVKNIEREVIEILGRYFGLDKHTSRGYVTSGGTESNTACMWWSRLWLCNKRIELLREQIKERENYTKRSLSVFKDSTKDLLKYIEINKNIDDLTSPIVFCSKDHTHYSIKKISALMKLDISFVDTYSNGQIKLQALEAKLIEHISQRPNKGIMMIVNIGTTITGAIDNVREVKNILDRCTNKGKISPYTIHADAACYGMIIPVTKPFGEVKDYFKNLGISTMTISGHKFLGTNILGIALTTKNFLEESFIENSLISYCGNIDDITISGSRSGLNVLWLYNTLLHLKLDSSTEIIEKIIQNNLVNARYFYKKLISIVGKNNVLWNSDQFNIVFPMPSHNLIKKYKLMPSLNNKVVACIQLNVDRKLIDIFINEYKMDMASAKRIKREI